MPSPSTPSPTPPAKPRELAPFLKSLREMLETESPSILRWTPDGRAFEILDLHQMTHIVLPKYFKHTKYASFQRQLNYFQFRKWTKSKSAVCTFANPHFCREAPELAWRITRKRDAQKPKRTRAQSLDGAPTIRKKDRTASESSIASEPLDVPADRLLEWIDDQFPSVASLERLDDAPPVWTPYSSSAEGLSVDVCTR